ncbi:MAG TPA: hypothetical protein VLS25_10660, partial [Dehalococcoidia bacterium]|nr:hypothetical protein [Dehalococcoidia bacterium]
MRFRSRPSFQFGALRSWTVLPALGAILVLVLLALPSVAAAEVEQEPPEDFTQTTVICLPDPVFVGQATSCSAVVKDITSSSKVPPGSVSFRSFKSGGGEGGTFTPSTCALSQQGANSSSCTVTFLNNSTTTLIAHITIEAAYSGGQSGRLLFHPSSGETDLSVHAQREPVTRFAKPGGTGTEPCTDPSNPCSLFTAASTEAPDSTLIEGDEIVAFPGTYAGTGDLGPSGRIFLRNGVTLHGLAGQPRPVISSTSSVPSILNVRQGDHVFHLEVDSTASLNTISIGGGAVEDVIARSGANSTQPDTAFACRLGNVSETLTVRNVVCLSSGIQSDALGYNAQLPGGSSPRIELRNLTAIATGPQSTGSAFVLKSISPVNGKNASLDVNGIGVLTRGEEHDVFAAAFSATPGTPGTGATVNVKLEHSDFKTAFSQVDGGGGTASVSPANSGTNIIGTPQLAADGYHERVSSPTVDTGATDALSSLSDIDGDSRTLGTTADIGADEFQPLTTFTVSCLPSIR